MAMMDVCLTDVGKRWPQDHYYQGISYRIPLEIDSQPTTPHNSSTEPFFKHRRALGKVMNDLPSTSEGLMLVEDPRETIQAICEFSDAIVDLHQYKTKYEEIIQRLDNPIHIKHAHTHFYSLTQFGILKPVESGKGLYRLSIIGKELCKSLENQDFYEYGKILRYILLNNPKKGTLFKKFVNKIMRKPITSKEELFSKFKEIPARALIAWSLEADLIDTVNKKEFWLVDFSSRNIFDLEKFWSKISEIYSELSKSEIFGIDSIFVEIRDLTAKFCIKNNCTINVFDNHLQMLLDSDYGEKIRLYGAPTSYFAGKKNFMYRDRVYALIRLMVN